MKNLMLFAIVALTTIGYSQEASVPNVKIKINSYRSYELMGYDIVDSTWSSYDSLTIVFNKFSHKLYGLDELYGPDTTTGIYLYDMIPNERLVEFNKSKETYDFNFTDSTLTRTVNGKKFKDDIVSYYLSYGLVENENVPYVITVVTKDGYERGYEVNFNNGTLEYDVKSKNVINSPFSTFTRKTNVVEFKKY